MDAWLTPRTSPPSPPPPAPARASQFGMVLGLAGLGNGWRVASHLWGLPGAIGELVMLAAAAVWGVLLVRYVGHWLSRRRALPDEAAHPVQSGFVALLPTSTLLMALAAAPHAHRLALALWLAGVAGLLAYGLWYGGLLWQGGRPAEATVTSMYLPTVGTNFVAATVAGSLGLPQWGVLFFGAGAFAWLSLESLVLGRHAAQALPPAQRASLGVQLAPPVVGAGAWLGLTAGPPDLLAQALFGYGLFQALLLLRLLPWLREQPFGAGGWAFSFGVTALPVVAMRLVERGAGGPADVLALPLFVGANLVIGALALASLARGLRAWRPDTFITRAPAAPHPCGTP